MSTRDELAEESLRRYGNRGEVPLSPGAIRNARREAFEKGGEFMKDALIAEGWRKKPSRDEIVEVMRGLGVDWMYDDSESATDAILALMDRGQ